MKNKIFTHLLALALTLTGSALAQNYPTDSTSAQNFPMGKGRKFVAGGFAYSSAGGELYAEGDGDRLTAMQFNPAYGYFVAPGFMVGGKFAISKLSQGREHVTAWGLGPQLLYFIGGDQPKISAKGATYPYLGASFLYTQSTTRSSFSDEGRTLTGTLISLGGGVLHLLTANVGLIGEAAFEIDTFKPKDGESASGNKLNLVVGFAILLD